MTCAQATCTAMNVHINTKYWTYNAKPYVKQVETNAAYVHSTRLALTALSTLGQS